MNTELFEDLTLKEDQARLNRCTELFASLTAESVESYLPDIVNYLHDTWSAIRSECGKQLAKKVSLFKKDFILSLLSACKISTQWQEIHGSILGLTSLLSVVASSNDQTIVESISELCLSLIGHVNIPVKESARNCLIHIQKQRPDRSLLLHRIVSLVDSVAQSSQCDTEASALQLDGLLGCLADTYQLFPELILPSEQALSGDSALEVAQTIRVCALHPASTVRQKAGQIITLFMLTFLRLPVAAVPPVVKYITHMLTEALQSAVVEVWGLQEIGLMVSEEMVRVVVEMQLETLGSVNGTANTTNTNNNTTTTANNTTTAPSAMLQHTYSYLNFLKNHLSVLLGNAQFEVRRMTIQLLPLLARAYVLLNASFGALNSTEDVDFLSQEEVLLMQVDMRIVYNGGNGGGDSNVVGGSTDSGDVVRRSSVDDNDAEEGGKDMYINRLSTCSDISESNNESAAIHDIHAAHSTPDAHNVHDTYNSVLNASFRSVHSVHSTHTTHHTHHTHHTIDIQLITQMVWLSELIKENQHLFESYTLDDNWGGSSATHSLQMRSHSIKDSDLHRQIADFALHTTRSTHTTTPSTSTTNTNSNTNANANTNTTIPTTNITHTPSHYTPGGAISKLVSGKHSFRAFESSSKHNTAHTNITSSINNTKTTNNTTNADYTRGVVDHWSLDVRGRLTEIEKRTQFHRSVRTLVNNEIVHETSQVCCLLLQNCRSVLNMCESMVYTWETAVVGNNEVNFMSTLHTTLHSTQSTPFLNNTTNTTNPTNTITTNNTTLSIDLIECFALIDSFLLSVMYRFTHCPDIQSILSNLSNEIDPEVELLQSAAHILRERLCSLYPVLVRYIARIQCIGKGSVHVGARAGVSGCSVHRVTAAQELLGVYGVYNSTTNSTTTSCGGGGGGGGGLFGGDALESDVVVSSVVSGGASGVSTKSNGTNVLSNQAIVDVLLSHVNRKMHSAESKDTTHTTHTLPTHAHALLSMEDVLRDIHSDRVLLIGSLTNTTVNLGSYSNATHHTTNNTYTNTNSSNTTDLLHSPPKHSQHSQHNTPLTKHTPLTQHTHSPTRYTPHITHQTTHTKYLSMDQWNCEAVSPLLTCLANATSDPRSALQFSAIVVEWCVACVMNPLWLDSRHNAKKNLFEALVLLLTTAESVTVCSGNSVESGGSSSVERMDSSDTLYILVVFRVARAIAELLALRSTKPLLELKTLMCSVKSAILAIRLCMHYHHALYGVFLTCAAAGNANSNTSTTTESGVQNREVYMQGWLDFYSVEVAPLLTECTVRIEESLVYYSDIYPLPAQHAHTHTTSTTHTTHAANSPNDDDDQSVHSADSSATSTSSSSDEFSDWDEDSDVSVPDTAPGVNDFNSSGHVNTLLPQLYEDMVVLRRLLHDWAVA